MFKRSLNFSIGLIVVLLSQSSLALNPVSSSQPLAPSSDQAKTTKAILKNLSKLHYASRPFNDQLSSAFFDNYLERLDGGRNYFLASDIQTFEAYRYDLDDQLKKGQLDKGFEMFNRYQQRVLARVDNIIEQLPSAIKTMDFSKDESLLTDRKEQPWPATQAEADDIWRKLLKSRILSMRLDGKSDEEIEKLLSKRYQNQRNRLLQTQSEDAFQIFINSLTELYDPHTSYLSPRTSENFNINMSLSLQGIGAVLQQEDEYTKVVRLVPAGPAFKQGELQPSDRIVGVAQNDQEMVDVVGMRLDEVVDLIRGEKGSIVQLEVIPVSAKTDDEHRVIKIRRDTVKLEEQSAQSKLLNISHNDKLRKIGVIDIPAFYRNFAVRDTSHPDFKSTSYDVLKLVGEMGEQGAEGIIIDLRDNGGGSLEEANTLTSLFIEAGATVQIRNSDGSVDRAGKNYRSKYFDMPLVVLINRLSASASEIFAGAMQDYQRGLIVGTPSFGKGTVQSINDLPQGQLKITQSKFYRVSGESTQHRGVVPDILFPALYDQSKVGESSLEHALAWDTIEPINRPFYHDFSLIIDRLKSSHQQRIANDPDFIFMKDRMALSEESKNLSYLPLNIDERKTLESLENNKLLAIENKRRKAKGLSLIASLDELRKEESDKVTEKTNNNEPLNAIDETDPLLNEAAQILLDSTELYRQQQVAKHR